MELSPTKFPAFVDKQLLKYSFLIFPQPATKNVYVLAAPHTLIFLSL